MKKSKPQIFVTYGKRGQGLTSYSTCLRCHKHLTKPESVQRGYGDICFSKIKTFEERQRSSELMKKWFNSEFTIKRGKHR